MDAQKNWKKCRACKSAVFVDGVGRNCVTGSMHDFSGGLEYKMPWGDVTTPGAQPGWGLCQVCSGLGFKANASVCVNGAQHEYAEFDAQYNVPIDFIDGTEGGWRWCNRCQMLWSGEPGSLCFAGGEHDGNGSAPYTVPIIAAHLQQWWLWCERCQGLTSFGGVCVGGVPHETRDFFRVAYAIGGGASGTQNGWRRCSKCGCLTFGGAPGSCYAGGTHEFSPEFGAELDYNLPIDVEPPDAQPGWRWCNKCMVLSYAQFKIADCPAGGVHDHTGSGKYSVWPDSDADGQPGWRLCAKCRTAVYGVVSDGVCRDGGAHDTSTSAPYQFDEGGNIVFSGPSFNRCHRCQALASGGPSFDGVCFDGAPHDYTEGSWYKVHTAEQPPSHGQPGWRMCTVCKQLALPAEDGSLGLCVGGAGHTLSEDVAFVAALLPPPAPVVPIGPAITTTESAEEIGIVGSGFSARVEVTVQVLVSGRARVVLGPTTDDTGGFRVVHAPTEPAPPTGAIVLARESADRVATARLRQFVPAAP